MTGWSLPAVSQLWLDAQLDPAPSLLSSNPAPTLTELKARTIKAFDQQG